MKIKLAVLLLMNSLLLPSSFAKLPRVDETNDGISKGRYITGGVVGSVVGFGVGHAIQKRYAKSRAWIFTAGESAALGFMFASTLFACEGSTGNEFDRCQSQVNQRVLAGSIVYWGFHIWEVVDLWTDVKIREAPSPTVAVMPGLLNPRSPGLIAVLQF